MNIKNSLTNVLIRKMGSFLLDSGETLRKWASEKKKVIVPPQSKRAEGENLALIAGYFSFEEGYATFGDTEAMKVACRWLDDAGVKYDIACHHTNGQVGLPVWALDSSNYDIFIFVCGPWKLNNLDILDRFSHCLKIGLNLSLEDVESDRFDLLYPRDLPSECNPDLVFSSSPKIKPTIGVCLVHAQEEYGDKQRHQNIALAVREYIENHDIAYVNLDTLYKDNDYGIENTVCFENLVSRLDVVISSRLHGMVFSLKNGVPVVAIDAIDGGAKLTKQASSVEWPIILNGNSVDQAKINQAVEQCMNDSISVAVEHSQKLALKKIDKIRHKFISDLNTFTTKVP